MNNEYIKRYATLIKDKLDKVYGNRVPLKMVYTEMEEVINQIYDDGYEANHLF